MEKKTSKHQKDNISVGFHPGVEYKTFYMIADACFMIRWRKQVNNTHFCEGIIVAPYTLYNCAIFYELSGDG